MRWYNEKLQNYKNTQQLRPNETHRQTMHARVLLVSALACLVCVHAIKHQFEEMSIEDIRVCDVARDVITAPYTTTRAMALVSLPLQIQFGYHVFDTRLDTQLAAVDSYASEQSAFDIYQAGGTEGKNVTGVNFRVTTLDRNEQRFVTNGNVAFLFAFQPQTKANELASLRISWRIRKKDNPTSAYAPLLVKNNKDFCGDVAQRCPGAFAHGEECQTYMQARRPIDFDGIVRERGDSVMCRKAHLYDVVASAQDACAAVLGGQCRDGVIV